MKRNREELRSGNEEQGDEAVGNLPAEVARKTPRRVLGVTSGQRNDGDEPCLWNEQVVGKSYRSKRLIEKGVG